MVTQDSNLDKLFREKFKGFAPAPPPAAWSGIQAGIAPAAGTAIWLINFRKTIAVAAAIVLLFSSGWYLSGLYNNLEINRLTAAYKNEIDSLKRQNLAYADRINNIESTSNANLQLTQNNVKNTKHYQEEPINTEQIAPLAIAVNTPNTSEEYDENDAIALLDFVRERNKRKAEKDQLSPIIGSELASFSNWNTTTNAPLHDIAWRKRKYSVGTSFGPMMSFSLGVPEVATGDLFQPAIEAADYRSVERAITTVSSGADISFKVSKRFSFKTGIYVNKRTQLVEGIALREEANGQIKNYTSSAADVAISFDRIDYTKSTVFNPENEVNSVDLTIYSKDFDLKQEFNYVEIPLMTKYRLFTYGIDVNLLSGFTAGILTGNKASVNKGENVFWKGATENLNSVLYSAGAGLGFSYNFSNSMSVNLEPLVKYTFTPVNTNKVTYNYPISFGIFSGISYSF